MPDDQPPKASVLDKLVDTAFQFQASFPQLVQQSQTAAMYKRQQHSMARMEAQVDAEIAKCNPNYKPPEPLEDDDEVNNFLNGVFIGSEELTKVLNAEGNTVTNPSNGRWWKALLSVLLGTLLTLLALWLYRQWFPPGTEGAYSIIAQPFQPPVSQITQ